MSNRPRPSQSPERRPTRRQIAAQQHEANVQRRVVLAIGGAVGLAILLIIGGFVYDRLIQPTQTLKTVNGATLTRGDYEELVRSNTIQQIIQGLQFSKLFGANQSLGQTGQFDEQVVQANVQLTEIGTSRSRQTEPDAPTIQQWVDRQILEQGAKQQFQIDPQQGEIDQQVVAQFGSLLESAEPITSTDTTTDTAETAVAGATSAAATTTATTPTATALPTATPEAAQATEQVNQIIDILYTEYTNILDSLPEGALDRQRTPHTTKEEMLQVMRDGLREQVIRTKVGEALVAEAPAGEDENPSSIQVRHILLQVPKPTPSPTPEATEEADATATAAAATPTTEPTPVPTPSVEELEEQFTERKQEADEIYEQLVANPDSFAQVASEKSEDPGSAANGGELDPFDRDGNVVGQQGQTLVKPFVDAAWALKTNEISQPVRTDFGWHIIQRVPEDPEERLERLRNEALDTWLEEKRT
ncbi:MAG: peptidyl-prolyl cis-trans isomerase, partial [Chloroflexi bacterium]|nr:peptidyl-prolyl cis-trans isomerase [Chloroflexota bacterium]